MGRTELLMDRNKKKNELSFVTAFPVHGMGSELKHSGSLDKQHSRLILDNKTSLDYLRRTAQFFHGLPKKIQIVCPLLKLSVNIFSATWTWQQLILCIIKLVTNEKLRNINLVRLKSAAIVMRKIRCNREKQPTQYKTNRIISQRPNSKKIQEQRRNQSTYHFRGWTQLSQRRVTSPRSGRMSWSPFSA